MKKLILFSLVLFIFGLTIPTAFSQSRNAHIVKKQVTVYHSPNHPEHRKYRNDVRFQMIDNAFFIAEADGRISPEERHRIRILADELGVRLDSRKYRNHRDDRRRNRDRHNRRNDRRYR